MKPTPPPAPDTERPDETEQKKLDLSLTQLVGGALAAMTAAYLGSRLSVGGTVVGAAVASLVAGIAGTLYTSSLRTTRDKVRSVWTGRAADTPTTVVVTAEPTVPDWGQSTNEAAVAPVEPAAPISAPPLWRTGRFWKRIAIGAVATFALTVGAITGLELVSGQSLSGGDGTTFSQVRDPAPAAPSESPSESPSAEPSESPSAEPSESPSAEPSAEPSEAPSEQPSVAPSAEPSTGATEEPSAGAAPSEQATQAREANGATPGAG